MTTCLNVFDLDHTLISANSSFCFGKYLYKKGFLGFKTLLFCLGYYTLQKLNFISIPILHQGIFKRLFLKTNSSEMRQLAQEFVSFSIDSLLYQPAIKKLKDSLNEGSYTLILSSSPHFLVEAIAKRLEVKQTCATCYNSNEQGEFASVGTVMDGNAKAHYVKELANQLGCPINKITAYTDSHLDLPLLECVGTPIGVKPNAKLRKICLKKGWEIIE